MDVFSIKMFEHDYLRTILRTILRVLEEDPNFIKLLETIQNHA